MKRKTDIWVLFLLVNIFVICPSTGIALAQTRPSIITSSIKTKLGRTAVIEKPAFPTMMIKGQILDPNNKPAYGARIIALPVTSWGYEIRNRNKKGYFELPWSPTWIENDQPIYLLALIQDPKSQAALVKITDPALPVTVRLEPAFTLKGKAVDTNGQQIKNCYTTISLSTKFKCKAPIFRARRGLYWEHMLSPLPYGAKYIMTIEAEGYQSQQIIVDGTDKSQKVIDIGTIILQPKDSIKSHVKEQEPNPVLAKVFHDIYRLGEGEIIKHIKPPFVLGRQEYFQTGKHSSLFHSLESQGAVQVSLFWNGELSKKLFSGYTYTHIPPKLEFLLHYTLRMSPPDYNIPKELNFRQTYGDWIVRVDSTKEEQLKALEEIIYAETNRAIQFEKRKVERDVIVAKGRYKFKPHPNGLYPNHIHVTWDGTLGDRERTSDSLSELFWFLERDIKMKIVDETEPMENTTIRYKTSTNLAWLGDFDDVKEKYLGGFLFNLSLTTSLQFKVENRPSEIWFVTETK